MKEWARKNPERLKTYNSNRKEDPQRLEKKRAAMVKYRKTQKGKETGKRYMKEVYRKTEHFKKKRVISTAKWREENRDKTSAHSAVAQAIKSKKLEKLTCEFCFSKDTVAHHDDYSKPLDVRWLCRLHHAEVHCTPASIAARKRLSTR